MPNAKALSDRELHLWILLTAPAALSLPAGPLPASAQEAAVALNNADVAADYAGRLRAELEGSLGALLGAAADRDRWGIPWSKR